LPCGIKGALDGEACTWWNLLHDQLATKSNPHLLTMMEICYNVKKQRVIQNEIMVFHRHPQPTLQNPQPYIKEMWKKVKLKHKYSKVLFA
jgi:hypothetical protein